MSMLENGIENDIQIGKQLFESLPDDIKPGWAGYILSRFDNYAKEIPTPIQALYSIIDSKERWQEAHAQFSKIRQYHLDNKAYQPEAYLRLAELAAKVTYNASGQPAPFDYDSGHYIASTALKTTAHFNNNKIRIEVTSAIRLFARSKELQKNLITAKDFLLYKKVNDILWFEWDPIDVNHIAPRDEYQSYVPEIFKLVKVNAGKQEIADTLYTIGTKRLGSNKSIESCLLIAEKLLQGL